MLLVSVPVCGAVAIDPDKTFADNVLTLLSAPAADRRQHCRQLLAAFPIQSDWVCQDTGMDMSDFLNTAHPQKVLQSIIARNLTEGDPAQYTIYNLKSKI